MKILPVTSHQVAQTHDLTSICSFPSGQNQAQEMDAGKQNAKLSHRGVVFEQENDEKRAVGRLYTLDHTLLHALIIRVVAAV